ncbi:hypothetical protein AB0K60_10560 [Thermopolyspora sp. NPDC052614]|uniref:hypothetical protein n=1 Tax=Thermopolyspora sp. NPDC052614 TaxID=3155682 RepID=UPI0034129575
MNVPRDSRRPDHGAPGGSQLPPYDPNGPATPRPYHHAGPGRPPVMSVIAIALALPSLLFWLLPSGWGWPLVVAAVVGLAGTLIAVLGLRRGERWGGTVAVVVGTVTVVRVIDFVLIW